MSEIKLKRNAEVAGKLREAFVDSGVWDAERLARMTDDEIFDVAERFLNAAAKIGAEVQRAAVVTITRMGEALAPHMPVLQRAAQEAERYGVRG